MLIYKRRRDAVVVAAALLATAALAATAQAGAKQRPDLPAIRELADFAAPGCGGGCGSGSTMGPDGALYATDGKAGRVLRVDRDSGAVSVFASGLPLAIEAVGIGGAIDVAFIDHTAYVLVTLVGPFFGQAGVVDGLYRIEPDGSATAVADIGTWSTLHPPATDFAVASGVRSTRSSRTAAASSSRTGITTACSTSRLTAASKRRWRSARSSPPVSTAVARPSTWARPARFRTRPRTGGSCRSARGRLWLRWRPERPLSSTSSSAQVMSCSRSLRACGTCRLIRRTPASRPRRTPGAFCASGVAS